VTDRVVRCIEERTSFDEEFRILLPDGSVRWLADKSELILDREGIPERLVGVSIDITSRKQIEEALAKACDEALEASRMKSQFLATVSHEIRTPMNAIIGVTGLVLDTALDADQRNDLETIRSSAIHLLDLINDILDLSKAEAGKLVCESAPFDLHASLAAVAELMEPSARAKGLALRFEYPDDLRRQVVGDAGRVRQILLNFVSNAVKFTASGSISIRAQTASERERDFLRLTVSDSGPGIAEDLRPVLFGRFVQGDSKTNRKHDGTGLGLAISKWLAEAMGGRIGTENRACGGADFWVDLPLPPATVTQAAVAEPRFAGFIANGGRRVLIAEDNVVNQKVMVRLLEKRGLRADIASNGIEAIEMWRHFPYDLILMDCRMPEMDGYEASRRIRALEPESARVPIVAVTAHTGEAERQLCLSSGMDAYLQKPFQPVELDQVLIRFLDRECAPETNFCAIAITQ
jgi:signal transduction histidine kinase/ActR/RegA family two-component response regulator